MAHHTSWPILYSACAINSEHDGDAEQNRPVRRGELFGEVAVRIKEEALLRCRDLAARLCHGDNWVAHLQRPRVHYFLYLDGLH